MTHLWTAQTQFFPWFLKEHLNSRNKFVKKRERGGRGLIMKKRGFTLVKIGFTLVNDEVLHWLKVVFIDNLKNRSSYLATTNK